MIAIETVYGNAYVGIDDEYRAQTAAEEFLAKAGVDEKAAETEYRRQWEEFDDEEPMTGLARVWIGARNAADIALTQGWHNAYGASCTIRAY